MIAYQSNFENINNTKYFSNLKDRLDQYLWKDIPIKHSSKKCIAKSSYLIGKIDKNR